VTFGVDPVLIVAILGMIASILLAVILIWTAPDEHTPYDWNREGDFK
jgi:hypothetical protein